MKTTERQQLQKVAVLDLAKSDGACLRILCCMKPDSHCLGAHNISINWRLLFSYKGHPLLYHFRIFNNSDICILMTIFLPYEPVHFIYTLVISLVFLSKVLAQNLR